MAGSRPRTQAALIAASLALYYTTVSSSWAPLVEFFTAKECEARRLVECKDSHTNKTQHDLFVEAQGEAGEHYSTYNLAVGLAQLFACPIVGALSDRHGRRPAMAVVAVSAAATAAAVGLDLSPGALVVVSALTSLGGGQYAIVGTGFAAVADVTASMPLESRVRYFGVVEAALWLGLLAGPTTGGHLTSLVGAPRVFFFLALPAAAIPLLLLALKETNTRRRHAPEFDWRSANVVGAVALLGSTRATLALSCYVLCAMLGSAGLIAVTPLYAQRVFGWTSEETGHLFSVLFGSSAVGLGAALPGLTALGASEPALLRISMLSCTVTMLAASAATRGWQLLVVVGSFVLNGIYFPVMRAMVARAFGPAKFGIGLGAVATLQQISQVVSPTVFPLVWKATAGVGGTIPGLPDAEVGPRVSFSFIPAGFSLLALAIACVVPEVPDGAGQGGGEGVAGNVGINQGVGDDGGGYDGGGDGAALESAPLLPPGEPRR